MKMGQLHLSDIQPKGFEVICMEDFITPKTVEAAQAILSDTAAAQEMAERNYELARQHYSFGVLRNRLITLLDQYRTRRSKGFTF